MRISGKDAQMIWSGRRSLWVVLILTMVISLLVSTGVLASPSDSKGSGEKVDVIIIATNKLEAKSQAQQAGVQGTHELGISKGVSVSLPKKAVEALQKNPNLRVYPNAPMQISSGPGPMLGDGINA